MGRARRHTASVAVLLAQLLAACGSDSPDPQNVARDRLAGRYAHYDVVAYEGDGMKTLIVSYGFTDLTESGTDLIAQESFCFSEHRTDQPITTEVSDTFTQAIRPVPIATTLTIDSTGRASLDRPETPTPLGIELADPAVDPLPTDPNDPRIIDADGDGKPGVTVRIIVTPELSGELYLARRERFAYSVTEQPDGSLVGSVRDKSEQLVIGASNEIFLTKAQWVQHPDPAKSPIVLKPVERNWDCAKLRAQRGGLFPPTPTVDW